MNPVYNRLITTNSGGHSVTKRNIVCFINSLSAGGAERVMATLVNHWASAGWRVTLFTFELNHANSFYSLHPKIIYRKMDLAGASNGKWHGVLRNTLRLRALRQALKTCDADVVLSFCTEMNVLVLLASVGIGIPVIVSERADPRHYPYRKIWRVARYITYIIADSIVLQSQHSKRYFNTRLYRAIQVIPNPVTLRRSPTIRRASRVLAVGRLSYEKGFDLLLEAWAHVIRQHPDWRLRIVGEGPEKDALLALTERLGVTASVEILGLRKDIEVEYSEASVFVLPSRSEGFPNALCEAMAAGLPVVAFKCAGGVLEMLNTKNEKYLARESDSEHLAELISKLLSSESERARVGGVCTELARRYSPENIFPQWDLCINYVTNARA